jgi:SanA protein
LRIRRQNLIRVPKLAISLPKLGGARAAKLAKVFTGFLVLLGLAGYLTVRIQATPVYTVVSQVPELPIAIVFGAGIDSQVLQDRVQTAISLYKSGKISKILMTGDNAHTNYDEPNAMKLLAVKAGIPVRDVVCDYAGFRTYDSLYRARDIFGVRQATLVTQGFHLPRAMFVARQLGLTVVGIDASLHSYGFDQCWLELREIAAIQTAWFDLLSHRKPKFLGKKEPIFAEPDV